MNKTLARRHDADAKGNNRGDQTTSDLRTGTAVPDEPPTGSRRQVAIMLHLATRACVRWSERSVPDPFVLAIILTCVVCAVALTLTVSPASDILDAWYRGIWEVMPFTMQMVLMLTTGVALAKAPVVMRVLKCIAAIPSRQTAAAIIVFLTAAVGCWINWGFGLVIGALLAREIAKRLRDVDFGFLVAAAYMGFMVWASGLSSSIALASATHGSPLNFLEQATGHTVGFDRTVLTAFNLLPVVILLGAIPVALAFMAPLRTEMNRVAPETLLRQDEADEAEWVARSSKDTVAARLENTWLITAPLVCLGLAYEYQAWRIRGFAIDINAFIFIALMLGLILHGTPARYLHVFYGAARTTGPILLQFPIYGGIMGIMAHTGLARLIAETFVSFATSSTLAFWAFVSSCVIRLLRHLLRELAQRVAPLFHDGASRLHLIREIGVIGR